MSLEIKNLSFSYSTQNAKEDKVQVLSAVSFNLPKDSVSCVLGPNGVGKSTLFKCILGLLKPSSGSIKFNGIDLDTLSVAERAKRISYIPQLVHVDFDYSVFDYVLMASAPELNLIQKPKKAHVARVYTALEKIGIYDLKDRPVTQLSGGQLQLVQIARALTQDTELIIMDEPTSFLDFSNTSRVLSLVQSLAREGKSILMSSHQPELAYLYANYILALKGGKVLAMGPKEKVICEDILSDVYDLDVAVESLFKDKYRACVPRHTIRS